MHSGSYGENKEIKSTINGKHKTKEIRLNVAINIISINRLNSMIDNLLTRDVSIYLIFLLIPLRFRDDAL